MQRRAIAAAVIVVAATGGALALGVARRGSDEGARCGAGFLARGPRCEGAGTCAPPLAPRPSGCDAPDVRVLVPAAAVAVGPSDWEAEGRVVPRTIRVEAFRIDAFEVTRGRWGGGKETADAARAASGMTRAEAQAFCRSQGVGGRLPTEDEWIVAAVSAMNPPRRYPWGDTGAVCRRAAWGLNDGPCAHGLREAGPDTVGAHGDGDTPLGLHDMAGNVAEWVSDDAVSAVVPGEGPRNASETGVAKGGSWSTALAAELRIWARLELAPESHDSRVGVRCVYPP